MRERMLSLMVVVLVGLPVAAAVPGDVNGDGVVGADDVSCVVATAFDPTVGCAVAGGLQNVITVSASGGDFTSLVDALASITNSSVSNRYLVVLGPGTYFGPASVPDNVTLVGAGKELSRVQADSVATVEQAAIRCEGVCDLRDLDIRVSEAFSGVDDFGVGVYAQDYVRITDCSIAVSSVQTAYGVYATAASVLSIRDSEIEVASSTDAYGVWSGNLIDAKRARVRCSSIDSTATGVEVAGWTKLQDCEVTITTGPDEARGAIFGWGGELQRCNIMVEGASATALILDGCTSGSRWSGNQLAAAGSTLAVGIDMKNNANVKIADSGLEAISSATSWGVANDGAVLWLYGVDFRALGGSDCHGVYQHTSTGTLNAFGSLLSGTTDALLNEVSSNASFASCQLDGGIDNAGGGMVECVFSWDGNLNGLNSSCQ